MVAPWTSSNGKCLEAIDAIMHAHDVKLFDLPWTSYEYVDGDHFTDRSYYESFVTDVANALHAFKEVKEEILILSDSTIDWFGKPGRDALEAEVHRVVGKPCTVNAINGSGFCALSEENKHFRTRLSTHLRKRTGGMPLLVLLGGWNDARDSRFSEERVELAVDSLLRLYHRYSRLQ